MSDKIKQNEVEAEKARKIKDFINLARGEHNAVDEIEQIPDHIVQKASLISAHFLLPSDALLVDMGCGSGKVTYAMALLNPLRRFIGIDNNRRLIEKARSRYKLPNLSFRFSDARIPDFEDESVDGIINSNILHEIYSAHSRDPDIVSEVLSAQIKKLKPGGSMLIRDYLMPPHDEYVLLELPDVQSIGDEPGELSYADLLIQYSQTARPMEDGYEGFFLEELDPSILKNLNPSLKKKNAYEMTDKDKERLGETFSFDEDNSRVFRLLHKWAIEFIHRKDEREIWQEQLDRELTFFEYGDYRRELARFDMRLVYTAPYRNPWVVEHFFKDRFCLYTEDARMLPPPATNYFIVAQKMPAHQSLILEERRPSQAPPEYLEITTVRDNKTGMLHEIARRPGEYCDIIPYRFTSDGRLLIYVRSGYPRPIINAVMRGNANLDGKHWSGHLIEPITMDTVDMTDEVDENKKMIIGYLKRHAKLQARKGDNLYVGLTYFPAPDQIDEAIEPVFAEVNKPGSTSWPIGEDKYTTGFKFGGTIMELDANDIIRAAQVGLLPEPRLEMHVFDLMLRYGIEPPPWVTGKLTVDAFRRFNEHDEGEEGGQKDFEPANILDIEQVLDEWETSGFSEESSSGKHLKAMRSVFVEEGKFGGALRGIASKDYEFIVSEDGVENLAVVYPLTRGWDDSLMMGVEIKNLPVPQRLGGSGATITAPSFVMPRDVRTIQDAKSFVGQQFGVSPDRVWQLGDSYFTHTGITPQRVYPFIVAAEGKPPETTQWEYHAMKRLWILLYTWECFSADLVKGLARTHMLLGEEHGLSPERAPVNLRQKRFELNSDKTQVDIKGQPHAPLSRVMGQRGSVSGGAGANIRKNQEADRHMTDKPVESNDAADTPVSLKKKPTQKLSLDFNFDEDAEDNLPEKSLKDSYDKAQAYPPIDKSNMQISVQNSPATEGLENATRQISESSKPEDLQEPDGLKPPKKQAEKDDLPVLRAVRPERPK